MSISFRYDEEKRAIYGVMSGELTVEEYGSTLKDITSSEAHPPDIRSIWDLRDLDFSGVTREFEEALVEVRAAHPERRGVRLTFVVSNELGFGMTRMFEILGDRLGDQTTVFRSYSEAESWLLQD